MRPLLQALQPLLGTALVSPAAFQNVLETVSGVPWAHTSGYLECRLGEDKGRVDILLTTLGTRYRRQLATAECWPRTWRREPLWRQLLAFYAEWARPGSWLGQRIPLTVLEFDVEGPPGAVPVPGLHVCVDPDFERHPPVLDARAAPPGGLDVEQLMALTDAASELLPRGHLGSREREWLRSCREGLPARGRVLHLSRMFSRSGAPLKLNVLVPHGGLVPYLDRIGSPIPSKQVRELLARYVPGQRLAKVDVALEPEPSRRLGLEVSFRPGGHGTPRWARLFQALVADGLCTREERAALLAWRGPRRLRLEEGGWPLRLERDLVLKFVLTGAQLQVKAYLFFQPCFSLFA